MPGNSRVIKVRRPVAQVQARTAAAQSTDPQSIDTGSREPESIDTESTDPESIDTESGALSLEWVAIAIVLVAAALALAAFLAGKLSALESLIPS